MDRRELWAVMRHPRFAMYWWFWDLRHRWYLRGRQAIQGRLSRYEAGTDIALSTLRILREFEQDAHSPYFMGDHACDGTLVAVRALIEQGEYLDRDDAELDDWAQWLRDVADVLPRLWD